MTETVEVFRVGPFPAGGSLYVPISRARPLEIADAETDVEGLRQIVAQWPEGHYLCSPDLADAAAELGLPSGALREDTEGTRIAISMSCAMDPDFDGVHDPWAVLILMTGARDFLRLEGERLWPARLSMAIELRGDREAKWWGVKLTLPYPGLALFEDGQHAKACALLAPAAQVAFCAEHPHLRVQLEPGPEYAMQWIREFYRIECMPRLIKRAHDVALADDEDALLIGGVLTTLAHVKDAKSTSVTTTETPHRKVSTYLSPAPP